MGRYVSRARFVQWPEKALRSRLLTPTQIGLHPETWLKTVSVRLFEGTAGAPITFY